MREYLFFFFSKKTKKKKILKNDIFKFSYFFAILFIIGYLVCSYKKNTYNFLKHKNYKRFGTDYLVCFIKQNTYN